MSESSIGRGGATNARFLIVASVVVALIVVSYYAYPGIVTPDSTSTKTTTNTPTDTTPIPAGNTVTDIEGNVYRIIKIGNQTWMSENLRTTKLNDGENIRYVPEKSDWTLLFTPGYCWPDNNTSNKQGYGALYNWYAVNTGKLAPKGWHVATEGEWSVLVAYLGGSKIAGGNLKKMNFTVRFAGLRSYDGVFGYFNEMEKYWTATEGGWHSGDVWYYTVTRFDSVAEKSSHMKRDGQSVRCVKDP